MSTMTEPVIRYTGKEAYEYQYTSKVLKRFVSINEIDEMDNKSLELLNAEIAGELVRLSTGERRSSIQARQIARLSTFQARLKGERKIRSQEALTEKRRIEHEQFKLHVQDKNRSLSVQAAKQARINKIFIGLLVSEFGEAKITSLMHEAQNKFSKENIVYTDLSD